MWYPNSLVYWSQGNSERSLSALAMLAFAAILDLRLSTTSDVS
jgi:hypothetical protein